MDVRSLIPWGRDRSAPARRYQDEDSPFLALHREMNRLFDDFYRGFGLPGSWQAGWPQVGVAETDREFRITAELPGMEEGDLEITLHDGVLTLKGEKKLDSDGAFYSERWHGAFERSLQLGTDVDPDKVKATFKNGLLTLSIAKRPDAQSRVKRIPISH